MNSWVEKANNNNKSAVFFSYCPKHFPTSSSKMSASKTTRLIGSLSKTDLESFLSSFDTVMSDCDGVLYRGSGAIQGSPDMIQKFRDLGKKVIYVTNNSAKVRAEYVEKFKALGYHAEKVQD